MRRRDRLTAACLLLLTCGSADAQPDLAALAWISAEHDAVAALTLTPPECYRRPSDPAIADRAEAGRVLFRSPLLLGGPAARNGLSCQSCHRNGHDNPHFYLPGLSDQPGTVDVTTAQFSLTREDGRFNPRPIPSLQDLARGGQAGLDGLDHFVRSVIVEEFQGSVPQASVFAALLTYIRALGGVDCDPVRPVAITLEDDLSAIVRGASALDAALRRGDASLADALLIGLRRLFGDVHARFPSDGPSAPRQWLETLSRDLATLRETLPDAARQGETLPRAWREDLEALGRRLAPYQPESFYVPAVLAAALDTPESTPKTAPR